MLDYRDAFREVSNAKQGFYAPRAEKSQTYLVSQFMKDPQAFKNQLNAEGKLQNKVKKRETPIGEYPKFRSSKEKQPVIYPE